MNNLWETSFISFLKVSPISALACTIISSTLYVQQTEMIEFTGKSPTMSLLSLTQYLKDYL